ncbi:MAG: DNA repair protein [Legionella sp. 40-6]|nr:DUF488 domain-containing protein [Legionella sp.]OJY47200.1 MAG: DNA repair protein [Legionella sp. 40-6]
MNLPFYTVGHSTRTIAEFSSILNTHAIKLIIDIRTVPKSRTNPQYNQDKLPILLKPFEIQYLHLSELGGLRGKSKTILSDVNNYWQNQSFHNYADYALSEQFQSGLNQLIDLGRKQQCVLMCAEALWWRCHRRIVSDYLLARGETVFHLMGLKERVSASLTPAACVTPELKIVYPACN